MKIVIIAQFPFDVIEGVMGGRGAGQAATWLPQLAKAWEEQKEFEIHWCVLGHKAAKARTILKWGQTFHLLPTPGVSTSLLLARIPQHSAFRRIFKQIQPDLIHCWGTENLHGAALDVFNGPSIVSMQGIITTYFKTGDLEGWRWKLFRHWELRSIRKATVVTSESRWGMDQVESIAPGKKLARVEYGVFPSYYDVSWQPDSEQPRILFVGGLSRLKGIDIILKMLRQHPVLPCKMVFAGGGYLSEALKDLNHPSVELRGMLKTDQVQTEMAKAWALIIPSRADTSPNVVKEARVIGLPVVGSPHGGHAEYIENGKDGYVIDSEDPDEWFEKLDHLASNYQLCRNMGAARHEWFRDYFRPEKTAEAFLELYRKMLS